MNESEPRNRKICIYVIINVVRLTTLAYIHLIVNLIGFVTS